MTAFLVTNVGLSIFSEQAFKAISRSSFAFQMRTITVLFVIEVSVLKSWLVPIKPL